MFTNLEIEGIEKDAKIEMREIHADVKCGWCGEWFEALLFSDKTTCPKCGTEYKVSTNLSVIND